MLYALVVIVFVLEIELVLIFFFSHEGTIDTELIPLLGRKKNQKHFNKNQANKYLMILCECKDLCFPNKSPS